jgi:predicted nucleotidyltransferase
MFVPKKGTIVPIMSTKNLSDNLTAQLFGKARRAVLSLLYSHPDESFYLRQLIRSTGLGTGALQREVQNLTEAGIIKRIVRGRQVYYQANSQCPVFTELRSLIIKTVGVGDGLKAALATLADRIVIAFIYGSVARLDEQRGSDIDIMVVGDVSFAEVVSALNQTQKLITREINPSVYPISEFCSKLASGNHFLKTTISGPKLFIIGDIRELERLVKKRLAD